MELFISFAEAALCTVYSVAAGCLSVAGDLANGDVTLAVTEATILSCWCVSKTAHQTLDMVCRFSNVVAGLAWMAEDVCLERCRSCRSAAEAEAAFLQTSYKLRNMAASLLGNTQPTAGCVPVGLPIPAEIETQQTIIMAPIIADVQHKAWQDITPGAPAPARSDVRRAQAPRPSIGSHHSCEALLLVP